MIWMIFLGQDHPNHQYPSPKYDCTVGSDLDDLNICSMRLLIQ